MSNSNSGGGREDVSGTGSLFKSTAVLAGGTMASRVLGFLRNIVLARLFGTGAGAEVFFLALRIPNLFRDLVGEGAANSAVVPVLSETKAKAGPEEFWRLVSAIALWALLILSVITIVGMIFAPAIVSLMAPGFRSDPEKTRLAVELTRWMFPYLIFIGLTAHSMAVLAVFRSFVSAAFSPCLFNIAIIIAAWAAPGFPEPTVVLAWGVLAGGILQLAAQIPSMRGAGMRLERVSLAHPGARKCGALLLPRLAGSGVYQLNLVVDTICASLAHIVGAGGIAAIFYANQLIQLPLGVFGFAMATAALPALSTMAAQNDLEKFKRTVTFALENIFFIMIPVTTALVFFSEPLVRVLFERGEFGVYSTGITSTALFYSGLGLFAFGGSKILTTSFFALQDTKTPVKIAGVCLLVNVTLNVLLMGPMGIGGIALASAAASSVGFMALLYYLEKRVGPIGDALAAFAVKAIVASVVMIGIAGMFEGAIRRFFWPEWLELCVIALIGTAVYIGACFVFKVPQVTRIASRWTARGRDS